MTKKEYFLAVMEAELKAMHPSYRLCLPRPMPTEQCSNCHEAPRKQDSTLCPGCWAEENTQHGKAYR